MPKKISKPKQQRWRVPVRVDVTYLGHVFVEAENGNEAADIVWERKVGLKDIEGHVYHTQECRYLEGEGTLDDGS